FSWRVDKGSHPDWADKQHAAAMPKHIEPSLSQSARQFLHHVRGRVSLAGPSVLDRTIERPIGQTPAQNSADGHFLHAANQARKIVRPKMPFCFRRGGER